MVNQEWLNSRIDKKNHEINAKGESIRGRVNKYSHKVRKCSS